MILLDHKLLNLNFPTNDVEKAVKARLEQIKKSKKIFTLKDPNPHTYSDKGRRHSNPSIQFRLNTGETVSWIYTDNKGEQHDISGVWAQCDKPPRMNKEGIYDYEPSLVRILEEQAYDCEKSYEKIFFIQDIYNPHRVGILVEDKEAEVEEKNKLRRLRAEVEFMIFGDERLTEGEIRKLAYSRGINVENLPISMVRDELFNALEKSDKNKTDTRYGFEDFIHDARSMGKDIEILSQIQRAIERNLIKATQEKGWTYANGVKICVIPVNKWNLRNNVLLNKFMSDDSAYDLFLESTGIGSREEPEPIPEEQPKVEISTMKQNTTMDYTSMDKIDLIKHIKKEYDRFFPHKTKMETLLKYMEEKEKQVV